MHDSHRVTALILSLVRVVQSLGNFTNDKGGNVARDPFVFCTRCSHHAPKIRTFDVLHAEKLSFIAVILKFVDLDNVWVVQAGRQLGFLREHRSEAARRSKLGQDALYDEQLESAFGPALLGQKDFRHAAHTEPPQNLKVCKPWRDWRGLVSHKN